MIERWWKTRKSLTSLVNPTADKAPKVLFERSFEDLYSDPGDPLMIPGKAGQSFVFSLDKDRFLLSGEGYSPNGNRPFLRSYHLADDSQSTLWQSQEDAYQKILAVIDRKSMQFLARTETPVNPPNFAFLELKDTQKTEDKAELQLISSFEHPYPEFKNIKKTKLRYQRDDGVQLSADLYMPLNYDPSQGNVPVILWAYPREYKSAKAAGQIRTSPQQFLRVSYWGVLPYLAAGYAVMDRVAMPIIGEGNKEPNDTFVKQLVANAEAALHIATEHGVDRSRAAIAGHSYGAFMTANLLAHSDLFRAGIARSGAYNRTFTPFGFQAEERTYWQAPMIYNTMSPFQNAEKIDEPLLLIHGQLDNNSGTYPIQSERLYHALKGLGGTARLVVLPYESHGYQARESIQHLLWEQLNWLDRWVKRPQQQAQH